MHAPSSGHADVHWYHCSAGKDRTGVLSALLLLLAGVSRNQVVEEYCYTDILLAPWVKDQLARLNLPQESTLTLFAARKEYIESALDHLEEVYGTVENYFLSAGLSADEIVQLRCRLISAEHPQMSLSNMRYA